MVVMTVAVPIVTGVYPLNGSGLARRIPDLARRAAHRRSLCGHCREAQREGTRRGDKPVLGCHRSFLISLASSGACSQSSRLPPIRRRLTPAWLMATRGDRRSSVLSTDAGKGCSRCRRSRRLPSRAEGCWMVADRDTRIVKASPSLYPHLSLAGEADLKPCVRYR